MKPSFSMSIKINWSYWWRAILVSIIFGILAGFIGIIFSKYAEIDFRLWAVKLWDENAMLIILFSIPIFIVLYSYINVWIINKLPSICYKNFKLSLMHHDEVKMKFTVLDAAYYSLSVSWRWIILYLPITIILFFLDITSPQIGAYSLTKVLILGVLVNLINFMIEFLISTFALHWTLTRKKTGRWLKIETPS